MSQARASIVSAIPDGATGLMDHGIAEILRLMREELRMDIVFVSVDVGDDVVVRHADHANLPPGEAGIEGASIPREESLCRRVLDGRLPAVMPDVAALRATHDVPWAPVAPGAFMATAVTLGDGARFGTLCCLSLAASPGLNERHYQRLRMSARQIAQLVDGAGGR